MSLAEYQKFDQQREQKKEELYQKLKANPNQFTIDQLLDIYSSESRFKANQTTFLVELYQIAISDTLPQASWWQHQIKILEDQITYYDQMLIAVSTIQPILTPGEKNLRAAILSAGLKDPGIEGTKQFYQHFKILSDMIDKIS